MEPRKVAQNKSNFTLNLVFENEHFVVVDKPSGWLTIPGRDPASQSKVLLRELQGLPAFQGAKLFVCHRLDREVSGALLFAKNASAHKAASIWFESHEIGKTYEAWTEGGVDEAKRLPAKAKFEDKIAKGKKRAFASPVGKEAVTLVTFEGENSHLKWRLHPLTGRTHQLRYQLAQRGWPILGDVLYGAKTEYFAEAIALRSVELSFSRCRGHKDFQLPDSIQVKGLGDE